MDAWKISIIFETRLEDRLHLENTKKKSNFFGILLDLHYLCTSKYSR